VFEIIYLPQKCGLPKWLKVVFRFSVVLVNVAFNPGAKVSNHALVRNLKSWFGTFFP